jgi:hypothetical protein
MFSGLLLLLLHFSYHCQSFNNIYIYIFIKATFAPIASPHFGVGTACPTPPNLVELVRYTKQSVR